MSKRAIFEEVSGPKQEQPQPAAKRTETREARGAIAVWLWLLAALVAIMVLIGGLTRLTDSGLSITVWDPVMGAIPPLSEADWQAAFAAYQTTEEFREQNNWMTLADFKLIYWWEWGHRQMGRLIGVVWLLGFLWFLARRSIPKGWTGRLLLPGLLGGAQGALGWWMVMSGLDQLDVASYRLALHLGLAFLIFALLVWYARKIRLDPVAELAARRRRAGPLALSGVVIGAVFLQLLGGALVAGIDAGRNFPEWPLMAGGLWPPDMWVLEPVWRNVFENAGTVQFIHRMLGYLVVFLALFFAVRCRSAGQAAVAWAGVAVGVAVTAQATVGIVTVVTAAPLEWAIVHQAGALVLVAAAIWARFTIAYPPESRIARA